MSVFRINYEKIIHQANEIKELSYDLSREINNLISIYNDINNNWNGPASNEFKRNLYALISDMKNTNYSMSIISSTITNVANKIKKEDEQQAELARQIKNI